MVFVTRPPEKVTFSDEKMTFSGEKVVFTILKVTFSGVKVAFRESTKVNNFSRLNYMASRFSRYFWGVMPSIFLKVRCRTVR